MSVDAVCRSAAGGRRAARALAAWATQFKLSEPEFQVLWYLRSTSGAVAEETDPAEADSGWSDQATIARDLAVSPAQVSAIVERLRIAGWIIRTEAASDRRRRLWRLTFGGRGLLGRMLKDVDQLLADIEPVDRPMIVGFPSVGKEAA